MMNLSINLALGSPAPDSVVNTVSAGDDVSEQGFSLTLADEMNARELTPPIVVDDTKATDPKLLALIAARQKLATAEAEAPLNTQVSDMQAANTQTANMQTAHTQIGAGSSTAAVAQDLTDKAGRIWLDEPLTGLPPTQDNATGVAELDLTEKPWFDIIEKAKNYSSSLQASKTGSAAAQLPASVFSAAETPAEDSAGLLAEMSPDMARIAALSDAIAPHTTDTAADAALSDRMSALLVSPVCGEAAAMVSAAPSGSAADHPAGVTANAEHTTLQPALSTAVPAGLTGSESAVGQRPALQMDSDIIALQQTSQSLAAGSSAAPVSAIAIAAEMTQGAQPTYPLAQASAGTAEGQGATDPGGAESLAQVSGTTQGEISLTAAAPAVKASALTASDKSAGNASHNNEVSAQISVTSPVVATPSPEVTLPLVSATLNPTGTPTEKTPAANAFAQHMKAVNQTQAMQPQQQSAQQDSQQQPGQARLVAESVSPHSQMVAGQMPAFSQQLQQLTDAAPATPTHQTILPTQSQASALTSSPVIAASRLTETSWQAPLALTEPAAAQQIKDRVMVQIQHKLQSAEVQLHPEDLGAMQIKLNLQQDQLSVQFVVQQGAAKEALEQQMPKLRELLEQQGIALSEGQVEQRQSGSQQDQPAGRHGNGAGAEPELAAVQTVQMQVSDRMVDFYA